MTTTGTPRSLSAPPWPHCARGADPASDPVGCRGRQVEQYGACLTHLTNADRSTYLGALAPGRGLDHRGTPISQNLLQQLLDALRDPATGRPCLGNAWFDGATFSARASFDGATFSGDAGFGDATFSARAGFRGATFSGEAWFNGATFSARASFGDATFSGDAGFREATFASEAGFRGATLSGDAVFSRSTFSDNVMFDEATFSGDAWFDEATFSGDAWFDEATFSGDAVFNRATFSGDAVFNRATFSGAIFDEATFSGVAAFNWAMFPGDALFNTAAFSGEAWFDGATFSGDASFDEATYSARAIFEGATFSHNALFDGATFSHNALFRGATFSHNAYFRGATFSHNALFRGATFSARAVFGQVTFSGEAWFDEATFSGDASFREATFETATQLGPLICQGTLSLSGARFNSPVTLEAAAARIECQRTRWDSTAALRLRYATVDLNDAVLEYPLSITARTAPFTNPAEAALAEGQLVGSDPGVRMASLRGADAAHLVLHNVDLSACVLSGTVHLDQLRLEGECPLAPAPSGLRRRGLFLVRWTARRTLAEEQHWHANRGRSGWTAAPAGVEVVGPAQLAPVYRQLRKSFEDSKNEPDAADFYYGEMQMRRHDRNRPRAERALLALYWAVSGYGLRASRALGWLLGAMAATVLVMMLWGLPVDDPKPATTGQLTGQDISLTTDKPDPVNPTGSLSSRLTAERWEKSLRIVVNSVVFRSSGQDLTTAGTYTEMASRLAEPVLLGLAVLAVRGRVKR
ncbi:pentapeptide repeat-containing protein [Streptomyces sp. NPDC002133]|uniref:pentapeptide repeat-containing protein n=1 Tax=Streptomyces sp. NPDC002133 TaxID=3154409 RepID=UPI00332A2F32